MNSRFPHPVAFRQATCFRRSWHAAIAGLMLAALATSQAVAASPEPGEISTSEMATALGYLSSKSLERADPATFKNLTPAKGDLHALWSRIFSSHDQTFPTVTVSILKGGSYRPPAAAPSDNKSIRIWSTKGSSFGSAQGAAERTGTAYVTSADGRFDYLVTIEYPGSGVLSPKLTRFAESAPLPNLATALLARFLPCLKKIAAQLPAPATAGASTAPATPGNPASR